MLLAQEFSLLFPKPKIKSQKSQIPTAIGIKKRYEKIHGSIAVRSRYIRYLNIVIKFGAEISEGVITFQSDLPGAAKGRFIIGVMATDGIYKG